MSICIAMLIAVGLANTTLLATPAATETVEATQQGLLRVESEVFEAVAYDTATRTLTLYFDGGEIYVYHDIPTDLFADLMSSESKGRFFCRNIRDKCRFSRRSRATPIADEMPRTGVSLTRKGRKS